MDSLSRYLKISGKSPYELIRWIDDLHDPQPTVTKSDD